MFCVAVIQARGLLDKEAVGMFRVLHDPPSTPLSSGLRNVRFVVGKMDPYAVVSIQGRTIQKLAEEKTLISEKGHTTPYWGKNGTVTL